MGHKFKLSENFINKFKRRKAPFGFNGLGELVFMRTYSRIKENGKNERWWETVQRVVEGTYSMQMNHIESHQLGWNPWQAQKSAQDMYERIFNMKFLPPGRGLWAMGTPITEEKNLYAALNNCAFVSTKTLKEDYAKPFCFLMDASMLGVGVGFDTKGAGEIIVKGINTDRTPEVYQIPDKSEPYNVEMLNAYLLSLLKQHLNDKEFHVLRLSYGLDCDKHSANQIADYLGIEGSGAYVRVSQLKKQAVDKLIENVDHSQVLDYL